jgi:hypothetical protein
VDVQRWFTRGRPKPMLPPVEDALRRLRESIHAARAAGVLVMRIQPEASSGSLCDDSMVLEPACPSVPCVRLFAWLVAQGRSHACADCATAC